MVCHFLHIIGRRTAPIMWFFIEEGFHYTHNEKNILLECLPQASKITCIILICIITFPSDRSTIAAMCPVFLL